MGCLELKKLKENVEGKKEVGLGLNFFFYFSITKISIFILGYWSFSPSSLEMNITLFSKMLNLGSI